MCGWGQKLKITQAVVLVVCQPLIYRLFWAQSAQNKR